MIERYSVGASSRQLADRYGVEGPEFVPRYNAAPSQLLPVLTQGIPRGFSFFYWGQSPNWTKNKTLAEKIINIRAEQILEKPTVAKKLIANRCIIPCDGFYAWKKVGKKTLIPWRFVLKSKAIFSIAGVWEEYEDEEGSAFHTFTMITIPSNDFVAQVSERMPLIMGREKEAAWLGKVQTEPSELMNPLPSDQMDGFSVSPQLNTLSFDRPSLTLPVPSADQHGNLTLFD